ncbi:MAG TPA: YncE family protein [Gemmatimonadales bacterium]|nr:YncE family protein [Gemmatimonadales bacterium]
MISYQLSAIGYQLALLLGTAAAAPPPPERTYFVYVASEGVDRIQLVRFGPGGASVERSFRIGLVPTEPSGPHGLAVAPGGKSFFVSTGHGAPFGSLWKFSSADDKPQGRVELGLFPATLQVSPDGYLAYVVNFNLYGDMVPSSVSVVATAEMVEVARIPTCIMPHGSRLNPQGTRHYSACMMDDMLVEIDTRKLAVSRHFFLRKGQERGMEGPVVASTTEANTSRAGHDMGGHGMTAPKPGDVTCSPTWAQPSADGSRIYVACNKASEIVEIDATSWTISRRWPAGEGVYNLAATHDGKLLIATNKRGQSVSIFGLAAGRELKRLPTKRKVVHGVAVSPDDRYAFVSVEGIGSQPGTVEMIDLRALQTVATVDVGSMAGGIDVWKEE